MGWFHKAFGFSSQPAMQYVGPIAQIASTMMGMPFVGAGLNTFISNANKQQQGVFDWGSLAKDAAINYGGAALTAGANKFFSSPSATGTSTAANGASGFAPAGTTLNTGSLLADGAASSTGSFLNAAPSALEGFSNAGRAGTSYGANNVNPKDTVQSFPQKIGSGMVSEVGGGAIANAMYPNSAAIGGGATEGALADNSGSALTDSTSGSAYDVFNPGNTTFDQNSYNKMISAIYANAGQQNNDVMDQFRGNGRWDLAGATDTPYGAQESQIKSGTSKTIDDATTEFNDRAALAAIKEANPQYYNDKADENYWLNEAKSGYAPASVTDVFGKYTKYAKPMENFQSYWAPQSMAGRPM